MAITGTSHDYDGSAPRVAPAGGITAGNLNFDTTTLGCDLALQTATSGATYTAKVEGLVKALPKITGTAWVDGQALNWVSASSAFAVYVSGSGQTSQATAWGAQTAGATTGDVILRRPIIGG